MGGAPSHVLQESLIQGGSDVLNSHDWFKEKGITHVVSVCEMTPHTTVVTTLSDHMHINIEDVHSSDLSRYFEETTLFIHRARSSGGRVYVHCAAGISRSSTIVLAYLMTWLELDFDEALRDLGRARDGVSPNGGFRAQLALFEKSEKRKKLIELMRSDRNAKEELKKLHEADLACIHKRRKDRTQASPQGPWANGDDDEEEDDEENEES